MTALADGGNGIHPDTDFRTGFLPAGRIQCPRMADQKQGRSLRRAAGLRSAAPLHRNAQMVRKIRRNGVTLANYSYLADGTKVSVLDSLGNGLLYLGSMVFNKTSDGTQMESIAWDGGRIVAEPDGWGGTNLVPYLYSFDHLGSVRAVRNALTGAVASRSDYEPYGAHTTLSGNPQRYRYNAKEDQSFAGTPYLDYGARQYDPAIGRWMVPDPLAEKYYSISPYVYCAGNPINLVDPDGMKVFPNGGEAFTAIINTLNEEDRDYIVVNDSGQIDKDKLNSHESKSVNYEMLKTLVNDEHMIYINVADDYQYRDNYGELHSSTLSFKGLDEYFEDPDCLKVGGTLMGDYGKTGITLLPGIGESNVNSPDNDIHVYIATGMSELSTAENYSHEANGHVFMYVITRNRGLSGHIDGRDLDGNIKELNTMLKAAILVSRRDTIKNYQGL